MKNKKIIERLELIVEKMEDKVGIDEDYASGDWSAYTDKEKINSLLDCLESAAERIEVI